MLQRQVGSVRPDSENKGTVGKETFRCLGYVSRMLKRQPLRGPG